MVDVTLRRSKCHFAILVLVQICLFLLVHFSIGGGNVLLDGDYLLCFSRGGERYCGAVDECHSVVVNVLKTC